MTFLSVKVQSISDVITNSSSEVFVCQNNTNLTLEQLKNFIEVYHATHDYKDSWEDWQKLTPEQRRNGIEGKFKVLLFKDLSEDHVYREKFQNLENSNSYLIVDTDLTNEATIKWLQDNLNALYF